MAKSEAATKDPKEKVELTPEQKEQNLAKRLNDNLATIKIALRQKDEEDKKLLLSKVKGKIPQKFVDDAVAAGTLTKKQAEEIKALDLIGAVKVGGGGKKSVARDWRWQIDTPVGGPTGVALKAIETDLAAFEDKHKDNLASVTKWYADNEGTPKVFATYFAKTKVKEEKKEDGK